MNDHDKHDKDLKKILRSAETPEADDEARKAALNLAMAEYKKQDYKKNRSFFQGLPFISRLTRKPTDTRRENMSFSNKKIVYGGLAMASVALLAVGVAFYPSYEDGMMGAGTAPQPQEMEIAQVEQPLDRWREIQLDDRLAKPEVMEESLDMADVAAPPVATRQASPEIAEGFVASQAMNRAVSPQAKILSMPVEPVPPQYYQDEGRDNFKDVEVSQIKQVSGEPVSTFSIDVDTASYSFVRKQLEMGRMPDPDAVRVEEMINYFDYAYQGPESREIPFKANVAVTESPWAEGKKLMHVGIKGYDIHDNEQPNSNLVFLLDVSGSMNAPDKLPLVKQSMEMLLTTLKPEDTISIVTYAGAAGTALEPTKVSEKDKIMAAMDNLNAGGSTAGAQGIERAYDLAEANFDDEAVNRVILATDGDFNVGVSSPEDLKELIEKKRESGIFLSVLGFGQGNLNDHLMQELAQNGNGVAAYIDNAQEARKVLVEEATSQLFPIAKDVKIQVEFNPETVAEYRLIGYETRALNREDFNNDKVDAGDIGAGHTVTAIYEITPVGSDAVAIDPPRYASDDMAVKADDVEFDNEYAFLKIRYKLPKESKSKLITTPVTADMDAQLDPVGCGTEDRCPDAVSDDVRFSIAVAGFGQLLKDDKYLNDFDYDDAVLLAKKGKGADDYGYRSELIQLIRAAKTADQMER